MMARHCYLAKDSSQSKMSRTCNASWGASACFPATNIPNLITTLNFLYRMNQKEKKNTLRTLNTYKPAGDKILIVNWPLGVKAIIIVKQSDMKLFGSEMQRACRVHALPAIVHRQPPAEIRRPMQVHRLVDHCSAEDARIVTSSSPKFPFSFQNLYQLCQQHFKCTYNSHRKEINMFYRINGT